jgi:trehalose 6-phosphate phosphatase
VQNWELNRSAVRPLWSEADNLRERVSEAAGLFAFFSFDSALAQVAAHGHLRTNPAARSALVRLCAAPATRAAVLSPRPVSTLQRRLRLHRLAYVGVHGADLQSPSLRLVTEPDREQIERSVARLRKACSRTPALRAPGVVLEDRVWALALHLRHVASHDSIAAAHAFGVLVASEKLQMRRSQDTLEACAPGPGLGRAALGLLAGMRRSLGIYVGAGEADEEGFGALNCAGGLSVHVGSAASATQARYQVDSGAEVIRLIHWLADARRR